MNMNIVNPSIKIEYTKPSTGAIVGGVVAGGVTSSIVKSFINPINIKLVNLLQKTTDLTHDEVTEVSSGLKSSFKKSGLVQKGVEILEYSEENRKNISPLIKHEIGSNKFLPKFLKKRIINSMEHSIRVGKNAFFLMKNNKIIMPKNKLSLVIFHELGHALNKNFSKTGRILQKCRQFTLLASPIALIALLKTKKPEGVESKSKLGKTTDFIKENAGKLTFMSFLPMLAEEGLASIKGQNLAKKALNTPLVKKLTKANKLGFLSYLNLALISSLGITLGVKVKDSIAKPQPKI